MVNPYPLGTFTPKETPSSLGAPTVGFSRRPAAGKSFRRKINFKRV